MLLIFSGIFAYYSNQKNTVQSKVDDISKETVQLNSELEDLQSKTSEIKKYRDLWPTIPAARKNSSTIKLNEITTKLDSLAEKYNASDQSVKLTLPEQINDGIFNIKTAGMLVSTGNVSFIAVNDIKALLLIDEFINSLRGYPIITQLSVVKTKDYLSKDLIDMSQGKPVGVVNAKIDFTWYVYKEPEAKLDSRPAQPLGAKEGQADAN